MTDNTITMTDKNVTMTDNPVTSARDDTHLPAAGPDRSGTGRFVVRSLTAADWPAAKAVDAAAFGYAPDDDFLDNTTLPQYDPARFTGVLDPELDGILVGIGGIQSRAMTFPGHGPAPVAAVTWVAVRPDNQRRGILREVMTHQLHGLHDSAGEPVAILTASEAGIYGRFGYGLATLRTSLEIPAPTALRPDLPVQRVTESALPEALPRMKEIHQRVRSATVGYLDREDVVWNNLFSEHPSVQKGRGPRRIALHADGYITYRIDQAWSDRGPDSTLTVGELCATTPLARASLWQHVLSYPLVRKVCYPMAWADEPLPEMLTNPRALVSDVGDHIWVRLVDLDRAIGLRTYSAPATVVVQVVDSFCPWNDGVWQLELGLAGGSAARSTQPAQIVAGVADLGAAFLGGTRIARLAAAGRVTGDPAAISLLDAAMGTALRPTTPEGF
ncbi:GNAT family N-acetyltransferase [Nakamurella sp. PAMC28650]|uniref:GNAT family N-acetyltransferase n=1 Tax=Nakamurella sp. PAMC28650 TaxID=2762325 RepID=UPI00164DE727|nr:GNAT family N-acetyltransferase [Nakamurella sp. PAMC28650]QNK80485.1 GNAT family N-acetyltransferase [Nakamurella sp. PAMC28650]